MKILHIVEASFAGVGRHVLDLSGGEAALGHDVHVAFSPVRESGSFRSERLDLARVQFHPVPMQRSPGPGDMRALIALERLRRRLRPDVIHTHSTKAGLLGRALPGGGAIRLHTPNAPYSMNPLMSDRSRASVGRLEKVLGNRRTGAVLAVSPEEVDHLTSIGVDAAKVRLVPNGLDPLPIADRDDVRRVLGIPLTARVIGFVGRFDDQKDPLRLIDAFERLAGHENAHLVMVGDGPLHREARDRVGEGASADRIHLLGEQPGAWSMAAFDVFALPSRYEGFPYVLLEAAAHGLPIVTTRDAGASQLVVDGISGWMIPSMDTDRLTSALQTALDCEHPDAIGAEAREQGRQFTVSSMVSGVLAEIESLAR